MFCQQTRRRAPIYGSQRRNCAAFSLVEVVIAMMITVIAITAFYSSAGQALRIMRAGKEVALASEILQERMEALRAAPLWTSVTTPAGLGNVVSSPAASAANLPGVTETFTITAYPAAGTPLVVTRLPSGAFLNLGSSLSAQYCVKVTARVNWTGLGNIPRSRQMSTIVTKGGL